jgi:methyltransferase
MIFGIDSRVAFTVFVGLVAVQRLLELAVSRRNMRNLVARGGFEVGRAHYPWMVALHSSFLAACVAEVWLLPRPWRPTAAAGWLVVLVAAEVLRWWTLRSLGDRWTTRVVVVPGEQLVAAGPYRWLQHPNYLVVVLELVAIPMVHGAWLTAILFSCANLALLRRRIRVEEDALQVAEHGEPRVNEG